MRKSNMQRSELERISNFGIYQRSNTILNTAVYNSNNNFNDNNQHNHRQPQAQALKPTQTSQRSKALNFNQSRSVSVNIDSSTNDYDKPKEEANVLWKNKEDLRVSSINENSSIEKQSESKVLENYLILDRLNQKQQKRQESRLRKQQQIDELKQKHFELEKRVLANNPINFGAKIENKINEDSEQIKIDNHQHQHQQQLQHSNLSSHYQVNKSKLNNSTNNNSTSKITSASSIQSQQNKQQKFSSTLQTSLNNEDVTKTKTSKLASSRQKSFQIDMNQNQTADSLKVSCFI
jgi:hypothetical protein